MSKCEPETNRRQVLTLVSNNNKNSKIGWRLNVDVRLRSMWIIIFALRIVSCSSLTTTSDCITIMTWNAFESENEIVFASCVSAVLHLVINGSRRVCKTHDNNGMPQKSDNLFYATNPPVGNCVPYLWQTKMKTEWRKKQRRLSKRYRKIISYPYHRKVISWHFFLFYFTL